MQHTSQQYSQVNLYNYHQQHYHHHQQQQQQHKYHHSSPTPKPQKLSIYSNYNNTNSNNSNHHHQTQSSVSLISSHQSSAYFLDRVDLEDYTAVTLQKIVETTLSKTESKGLKVKLSLPDDGLIINNLTDSSQSWILKTSELLYFWRDPYYSNVITVITKSRSQHSNRPYSASIFRLRHNDSAQIFLKRAQQFFAHLPKRLNNGNHIRKSVTNKSIENLVQLEDNYHVRPFSYNNKVTINHNKSNSIPKSTQSVPRLARTEFDPSKVSINSFDYKNIGNNRTYSETSMSNESQTTNSITEALSNSSKLNHENDDDNDEMNNFVNNLTNEQIVELVRELKALRNEIYLLKLHHQNQPSKRSMSTSPLANKQDCCVQTKDSTTTNTSTSSSSPSCPDVTSQSEGDVEIQTDFNLIQSKRKQLSKKSRNPTVGSSAVSTPTKSKFQSTRNNRRTYSNSSTNTHSEQEDDIEKPICHANNSSNGTRQSIVISLPPRPLLVKNSNSSASLNNSTLYTMPSQNKTLLNKTLTEEVILSQRTFVNGEKDVLNFPSPNKISSNSKLLISPVPIIKSSTPTTNPIEHIYENVPAILTANAYRDKLSTNNEEQQAKQQHYSHLYYTNDNKQNPDFQQKTSTSEQSTNATEISSATDNNSTDTSLLIENIQPQKPQIISAGRHRNQPIYFANHLTNPIFNIDKQLLKNTVANQFGVDLNSPHLQQLITNQHLFAARKRTFANMVWQLSPDEESALCSLPTAAQIMSIDMETINSTNSTARSILKASKDAQSTLKRRSISWDSALE